MDKLKELLASKKKEASEKFGGKKFIRQADVEQERIKQRMLEEEERKKVCDTDVAGMNLWSSKISNVKVIASLIDESLSKSI